MVNAGRGVPANQLAVAAQKESTVHVRRAKMHNRLVEPVVDDGNETAGFVQGHEAGGDRRSV
jgi:hypothetical protein